MSVEEVERIKNLIQKAETQKAKAEGVVEKIKSEWKELYGTDDENEIMKKLESFLDEKKILDERKESLFQKLIEANDWDKLEEELS